MSSLALKIIVISPTGPKTQWGKFTLNLARKSTVYSWIYSSDTARLCLERCEHFQVHLISDIQIQYILLPFNKFNVHAWSGWNHGLSISSQLDFMIIYWRDNYLLRGHVLSLLRFTTVLTIFWAHGLQINVTSLIFKKIIQTWNAWLKWAKRYMTMFMGQKMFCTCRPHAKYEENWN